MPAIGAVRPTAIIRCTKARRDNLAGLDVRNQVSKFPLFHRFGSSLVLNAWFIPLTQPQPWQGFLSRPEMDQVSSTLSKQDPGQRYGSRAATGLF